MPTSARPAPPDVQSDAARPLRRAAAEPGRDAPQGHWAHNVLHLQRSAGNAAVTGLLTTVHRAEKKPPRPGVAKYGTVRLTDRLQDMMHRGVLGVAGAPATLSEDELFMLQGVANVETGGKDNGVFTKDNMFVSLGFKQVTLAYGELHDIIRAAPGSFAKHGISFGAGTYTLKGGTMPAIEGAPDPADLKTPPWTDRFFDAAAEDEVVSAMVGYTLKALGRMERRFAKDSPGKSNPWMHDPTARAWLLEAQNNRPVYAYAAAKATLAKTDGQKLDRDAFLTILAAEIRHVYEANDEGKKADHIISKIPRTAPPGGGSAPRPDAGAAHPPAATEHVPVPQPTAPAARSAKAPGTDLAGRVASVLPADVAAGVGGVLLGAVAALGLTGAALRLLVATGHNDPSALTNLAFWSAHPDLFGTKLHASQPGFTALAAEWAQLRRGVVAEALSTAKPAAHPAAARPAAAHPAAPAAAAPRAAGPAPAAPHNGSPAQTGAHAPAAAAAHADAPVPHGVLADQVAAAHSSSVDAAAAKLTELQTLAHGLKRGTDVGTQSEELGADRDKLVAGIGELRRLIAAMSMSGDATQLKSLKASFYRAINDISPYYYQHNNAIFEYSKARGERRDVWNTCNITSTSMALEALGKSPADYDKQEYLPQVIAYLRNDLDHKAGDRTSTDLAGYRLPDVLAMAAVVEKLGYRQANRAEVEKACNEAFGWIPNVVHIRMLAEHFGVRAKEHSDSRSGALSTFGEKHWRAADAQGDARKAGRATSEAGLTEGSGIDLEAYKRSVLAVAVPALDAGKQIVVGQFNHFVRLQALDDQFLIKDDPGRPVGASVKINWVEARAMGLFTNWLVIE